MLNDQKIESIITQYFLQLTIGCDKVLCDQVECCSCPKFSHKGLSNTEYALKAVQLAICHPMNPRLCGVKSPYKLNDLIKRNVDLCNRTIFRMIRGQIFSEQLEMIRCLIYSVLTSENSFPFFLMDEGLTIKSIALDPSLIKEFVHYYHKNHSFFVSTVSQFHSMVVRLISTDPDTVYHVRGLLLVFLFDMFFHSSNFFESFLPFLNHILSLPPQSMNLFSQSLQQNQSLLKQAVTFVQSQLSMFIMTQKNVRRAHKDMATVLKTLSLLKQISGDSLSPYPSSLFSNTLLSNRLHFHYEFEKFGMQKFSYLSFPCALTLKFKHQVLRCAQENRQNAMAARSAIEEGILQGRALQIGFLYNILEIRRDRLMEDSIRKIPLMTPDNLSKKLMVVFQNEQGIDQGGVSREFFYLLINQIFSPDYGLFQLIHGNYYWFSFTPLENPISYVMLGTVISLAIYNNVILPIRFPLLLYKKILNKKIVLNDLNEIDSEFVKSIYQIMDMIDNGDDISEIGLVFSTTIDSFGKKIEIPLIKNGSSIPVTNSNIKQYIDAYIDFYSNIVVSIQYEAFMKGFMKISISQLFYIFSPDELDILVSGEEVLDWDALKKMAKYSDGYTESSPQVIWFWEIFKEMSQSEKKAFLRFATGSDKAPVGGLGEIVLVIQKINNPQMLPVSHTCFNTFSLPTYTKKTIMKQKILQAIEHSEGFGLV